MNSGQNLNNPKQDRRVQIALATTIVVSELVIIFLEHDLELWKQALAVMALTFLNMAFISFGIWQSKTYNALVESQRKEKHERERILTIINSLPDGILSVNAKGEVELFNSSVMNLLNTNDNLIGKNIHKLITLEKPNGEKFNFREVFRSGSPFFSVNDLVLKSDGESIRIELEILSIYGFYLENKKNEKSFAVILRDITKQKTLDEERDEFISVVSHELRTPVAITEGAISNLQMMVDKKASPELLSKTVDMTYKQVSFLANMVNDLSTLSRAERGVGDNFEEFCPKQFGEELFLRYQKEAEKKGLDLNLDIAPDLRPIFTSKLYIEELLQNIITNSIKYTKTGSVNIQISKSEDGKKARFSIRDTGIGISKTDQAKIYDKFYRSEDYRTRETGGTGLGLYISAKLAAKLGTKIELKSRLNHGSTFSFEIPFASTKK